MAFDPSTQWSVVLAAAGDDAAARAALAALCQTYWYPIYACVRRGAKDSNEASDLTQEFFTNLLERSTLLRADPARGRFRSFLFTALHNFLANERAKLRAARRGGSATLISLDRASAEARLALEPADVHTPERRFERQWACALLEEVLARLSRDFAAAGRADHFEALRPLLVGDDAALSYAAIGQRLHMTEEAARAAAYRLRQRYKALLREEIGRTVSAPGEVEDELRRLFQALSN